MRRYPLRFLASFSFLLVLGLILAGCGAPALDSDLAGAGDPEEEGVPLAQTEREEGQVIPDDDEAMFHESFRSHKHATVYTDLDTYDVRNIRFDTGLGFGGSDALSGYYLNTKLDLRIKYIDIIRVIDRVSLADVFASPNRYDMVEEQDADYIFRTELKKSDGERIEYIVRINRISGSLQEGGSFRLDGDELQTLRKVVFY